MINAKLSKFLPQKLLLYKAALLLLALGILITSYQNRQLNQVLKRYVDEPENLLHAPKDIPHYEEIMNILRPLEYSGIQAVTRKNVHISIDFDNRTWTLHNIHQYDAEGNIILENYRFGLCGELASYIYARIKPLLKDGYTIAFAKVAESGYFLSPRATHIALLITDKAKKNAYLLDPSFHRYGRVEDLQEYLFFEFSTSVEGIKDRKPDVSFLADHGTPLQIRNNFITSINVGSIDGKFDKDNFVISIKANRRYKYNGRFIYAIRKKGGVTDIFEDTWLENEVLSQQDIKNLKEIVTAWFNTVTTSPAD